jgi:uncharacterized protein (TIGR00369 family)
MSIISDLKPGLTGIAQLRAIIETGAKSPIHKILDISLVTAEDGSVTVEALPRADHENPTGVVQAGYLAALLDAACGYAVQSVLPNRTTYATLELKVSCHRTVMSDTGRSGRKERFCRSRAASLSQRQRHSIASGDLSDRGVPPF